MFYIPLGTLVYYKFSVASILSVRHMVLLSKFYLHEVNSLDSTIAIQSQLVEDSENTLTDAYPTRGTKKSDVPVTCYLESMPYMIDYIMSIH